MSLIGGIDTYSMFERYKSEVPPKGRKVRFLSRNGYQMELDRAKKCFEESQVLTVKEIYVGGSSSEVEFIEYPGQRFNTVMFADVK